MRPWLSVLMPTYRGERYVEQALASLPEAHRDEFEVVVVDDGSDDATLEIVDSHRRRLSIRIVDGPRRGNWVANTNRAIEAAQGEHGCFLHQDDGWLPGRFEVVRRAVASAPEARLFVHPVEFRDRDGSSLGRWRTPFATDAVFDGSSFAESLLVQNFLGIPAPVFRIADARAIGGLDESLWYTADWDFWLALCELGPVVHRAAPHAWFRIHGDSQTATRASNTQGFRDQMTKVVDRRIHVIRERARRDDVACASRMAIEANVALAGLARGGSPDLVALASAGRRLRLRTLRRFLRDSRIAERVAARVVDRLRHGGAS